VNWDLDEFLDDLPLEDWEDWRKRFQEVRETLKELPWKHLKQVQLRTQAWFTEAKEKWCELLQEALQVDRSFEDRFGNPGELRYNVGKSMIATKRAQAEVQEATRRISEFSYDFVNRKSSWDNRRPKRRILLSGRCTGKKRTRRSFKFSMSLRR
jgi:hypothetical protein